MRLTSIFNRLTNQDTIMLTEIRSSRPEVFCKKDVLKNFAKFTGKHLRQSLFFNKVEIFLIFPSFLRYFVESGSATRELTGVQSVL